MRGFRFARQTFATALQALEVSKQVEEVFFATPVTLIFDIKIRRSPSSLLRLKGPFLFTLHVSALSLGKSPESLRRQNGSSPYFLPSDHLTRLALSQCQSAPIRFPHTFCLLHCLSTSLAFRHVYALP